MGFCFPTFDYHEHWYYEYLHTGFCVERYFLLSIALGMEFLNHMVYLYNSNPLKNCLTISQRICTIYCISPPTMYEGSHIYTSSLPMFIVCLYYYSHPSGCAVVFHYDFYLSFLMANDVERSFIYILVIFISSCRSIY